MLFNALCCGQLIINTCSALDTASNDPSMVSLSKLIQIIPNQNGDIKGSKGSDTTDNSVNSDNSGSVGTPDLWPGSSKNSLGDVFKVLPKLQSQNLQPQQNQQQRIQVTTQSSSANMPDMTNIQCTNKCVRKEIHNMSPEEIQAFTNAFIKLSENGVLDTFVNWHVGVWTYAHFTSYFLPWHRAFTLMMEQALQKIDPSVCVPYWDHSREAQNPWASKVWDIIGGDGYGGCIRDGPFKDVRVNGQCIRRKFQRTSFVHVKTVTTMVKGYTQFQQFSTNFEVYPHATPHARIGGNMDGPRSPADPVFWLHHSWVEKVFTQFQSSHPTAQYSGASLDMSSKMRYVNMSPMDVIDASKLCYAYDQINGGENTTVTDPGSLDDWFSKMNVSKDKQSDFENEFEKVKKQSLLHGVFPDEPTDFNEGKTAAANALTVSSIILLSLLVNQ